MNLLSKLRQSVLAAAFAVLAIPAGYAAPIMYGADLGNFENPPTGSAGTGTAFVTFDSVAHTLRVQVSFSGLLAGVTASHIHCCVAPPGNVGVATTTPTFPGFPSGVMSGTYDNTFDTTLASSFNAAFVTANGGTPAGAEAALDAGLAADMAYFNIHTSLFPSGEIRGFLTPVPEPEVYAMLSAGLGLMGFLARRRRRQDTAS